MQTMQIWIYRRQVHLYETDQMGVVHHSNYMRYLEEARTSVALDLGALGLKPGDDQLAVYDLRAKYLKSLRFGDHFEIKTRARVEGAKVLFQYKIKCGDQVMFLGETVHVLVDSNIKVKRISQELRQKIGDHQWTEIWL